MQFEISGRSINVQVIGTGTGTFFGYLSAFNTASIPNGTYTLQSVATDEKGLSSTSPSVTFTIENPPTTSVVIPSKGATLSGSTYFDASASDSTNVAFWLFGGSYGFSGHLVVGTATPTIYGYLASWDTTTVPNGTYLLLSEAVGWGGSTFSSGVSITVAN